MGRFYIDNEVRADKKGYESLVLLYHKIAKCEDRDLLLDFTFCKRFDANLASVLGAILSYLAEESKEVFITNPTYAGVRRTLSRNNFLRAHSVETKNEERNFYIMYKKFSISEHDQLKKYIKDKLVNNKLFPLHTEKAGEFIAEHIYEIYVNAIMHGNCAYVHSCGEFITGDSYPTLDMTIVNCGTTIHERVRAYLRIKGIEQVNSCESLLWAIEEGNTTKDVPGGLGLYMIKDFIRRNGGGLQIISADAMFEYRDGEAFTTILDNYFPGTIVNMKFNVNDKNIYYLGPEDKVNIENIF